MEKNELNYKMEFKLVEKEKAEMQKLLNQWRHDYMFEIISFGQITGSTKYYALIVRFEKDGDNDNR